MYTEVLKFVPEYCSLLLGTWQEHGTPPTGSGFDFIVNAVWPEVVAMIDEKAAVIFAPGNPDTFHKVKFCTIAKNVSLSGFSVGSCMNRRKVLCYQLLSDISDFSLSVCRTTQLAWSLSPLLRPSAPPNSV